MARDDGGPAKDKTLLDEFAGQAIPAAVALWQEATNEQRRVWSGGVDSGILCQRDFPRFIENVTGWIAEAMIAAKRRREQEQKPQ